MAEDETRSQAFSTKEMLVRLDGKLDTVIVHQPSFAVRVALLEQRTSALEAESKDGDVIHDELRRAVDRITRKTAYAAGVLSTVVIVANLIAALLSHVY